MAYLKVKCLLVLVCFALYFADAKISKTKVSSRQSGNSAGCPQKGKRYEVRNEKVTFFEAWRRCHELGLRLATITSSAESELIKQALNGATANEPYWIGGTDLGREGTFVWISTGQAIGYGTGYTNFAAGEPNNDRGIENCLDIGNEGVAWLDKPCDLKEKFICEGFK